MFTHILLATDGSELGGKGVEAGVNLAKQLGARITVVTVTEMWDSANIAASAMWMADARPIQEYENAAAEGARKILDAAADVAKTAGVSADVVHVKDRHPAEGIVQAAEERGADLVVMASHGRRGIGRLVLGSQTNEVLVHSKVPVLVVR
jgi:nucleotide-binding universal stress UspA family protein